MKQDQRDSHGEITATNDREKKPYRKPSLLSREALEVIAATCDPGKSVLDIGIIEACGFNTNS